MLAFATTYLACLVILQADGPSISNMVATYGQLGPPRQDLQYLPGDILHFQFDISNLKNDEAGRMRYLMHLELFGPENKLIAKQRLPEVTQVRVFSSNSLRQALHIALPQDLSPGDYRVQITVEDSLNPGSKSAQQALTFKVLPLDFGIVQFQLYSIYTPQVQLPCPGVGVVGQTLHVTAVVLRGKKGKPDETWNLDVQMRLLDEQGKPVANGYPINGQFRKIPGDLDFLDVRFDVPVQEAGKFLISIQATEPGTVRRTTLLVPLRTIDLRTEGKPAK